MSRPRKPRAKLPLHVHAVKARGKDYYYYHPYRGTSGEGQRIGLPGAPFDARCIPNREWWEAYRSVAGEIETGLKPGSFSALILTNTKGLPWTAMGFRASWAAELHRPDMRMLREKSRVFHALRKSAVVFLLEAGSTDAEVAAVTGQSR